MLVLDVQQGARRACVSDFGWSLHLFGIVDLDIVAGPLIFDELDRKATELLQAGAGKSKCERSATRH